MASVASPLKQVSINRSASRRLSDELESWSAGRCRAISSGWGCARVIGRVAGAWSGAVLALSDVSLNVRPGEIVALLGSNGAVYSYGDASFLGAPGGLRLVAPLSGISSS